ncbi:MAG: ribosome silencing factor [Oscillospiraceae bacterium]|jgi:ribosome-associated protein|nr:ribosome silencing factor [Oscillospiraceae bacterium]
MTPQEIMECAVRALDNKKALDIKVLKTLDLTILADYFIICTANNTTQIKTLSDELEKVLKEKGEPPLRTEGYRSGGWVLTDFGSVIVHIFMKELREFYNLERLWGDAEEIDISEIAAE